MLLRTVCRAAQRVPAAQLRPAIRPRLCGHSAARPLSDDAAGGAEGEATQRGAATPVMTLEDLFGPPKPKHVIPEKRARRLLQEVNAAQVARSTSAAASVDFELGDAIEIKYADPMNGDGKPDTIKGVVIVRKLKASYYGASFLLRNVINGEGVEWRIMVHDPAIQSLKVLKKAFIHRGRHEGRPIHQKHLYWLRNSDPSLCTVK